MKWMYGVTTCKARLNDLLPRTLASLEKAGFPSPRLFLDGVKESETPESLLKYERSYREPRIRSFGNWMLAFWELYLRDPVANRYAIFQDDMVTCRNLRQYLERAEYPKAGYLNLYTFPENERPTVGRFYPSNQRGKGAVALVFDNTTIRTLLASDHFVERCQNLRRGHKAIDGGVVTAAKKMGLREFVHNPSLVQHTGINSSMGNGRHPLAKTFRGEEYDAMLLLSGGVAPPAPPPPKTKPRDLRVGLVGFNCNSGLGSLNRDIATHCEIDRWLVKPHRSYATKAPHADVDTVICTSGHQIEQFVKTVDVLVFCETPYYGELVTYCKRHGVRTICVPMHEWMPPGAQGWPKQVDLFVCPTKHCYDQFQHLLPCVHFPWPADTSRFAFQERSTCNRFLFTHGHGGFRGRKGGQVVQEALKLWEDMPLLVRTQQGKNGWGKAEVLGETAESPELYSEGDVLICPHSVDGIGLEVLEAQACGMPVIVTKGNPWDEMYAIARVQSTSHKQTVKRSVDWYSPDPRNLTEICLRLHGKDISAESHRARNWARSRDWALAGPILTGLFRGTINSQTELEKALKAVNYDVLDKWSGQERDEVSGEAPGLVTELDSGA